MKTVFIILSIYLLTAFLLFLTFIITKQQVKFTNYTTKEVSCLEGIKRISCFILMSLLWPYIFIRNIIKGEYKK